MFAIAIDVFSSYICLMGIVLIAFEFLGYLVNDLATMRQFMVIIVFIVYSREKYS